MQCRADLGCTMLSCVQVKIITRRVFDRGQLSGAELVQLMHGLARMSKYAPNQGWLAAVATAAQGHLGALSPGKQMHTNTNTTSHLCHFGSLCHAARSLRTLLECDTNCTLTHW